MQLLTKFIDSKEGLTMIRAQAQTSNDWQNKYLLLIQGQQYHYSVRKYARKEISVIALWI